MQILSAHFAAASPTDKVTSPAAIDPQFGLFPQ